MDIGEILYMVVVSLITLWFVIKVYDDTLKFKVVVFEDYGQFKMYKRLFLPWRVLSVSPYKDYIPNSTNLNLEYKFLCKSGFESKIIDL